MYCALVKSKKIDCVSNKNREHAEIRRNPQKHPINPQKYRFCLGVSCKQTPQAKTLALTQRLSERY